jgi:hypothetical protein
MKNAIATLARVTGVIAALFALLDWFLSKHQKIRLEGWLRKAKAWLEEQSSGHFLPAVWTTRMQLVLLAIYATPVVVWMFVGGAYNLISQKFGVFDTKRTDTTFGVLCFVFFLLFVTAFFVLHRPLIKKIVARKTPARYLLFMLSRALLYSISLPVALLSMPLMIVFIRSPVPYAGFVINFLVWPFVFEALILWNVLLLSLLWVAIAWLLAKAIRVLAFLLDRALSQEKGVLAGLAALFFIIAAVVKLVSIK